MCKFVGNIFIGKLLIFKRTIIRQYRFIAPKARLRSSAKEFQCTRVPRSESSELGWPSEKPRT